MLGSLLEKCNPVSVDSALGRLAQKAIEKAYTVSDTYPISIRLAATFDMIVGAAFYNNITHRGWTYCKEGRQPLLIYPYTNACPQCLGRKKFYYTTGRKPESGKLGTITADVLRLMLQILFTRSGRNITVYSAVEPVDVIVQDNTNNEYLLAEIKAAPVLTFPLAAKCEPQTQLQDGVVVSTNSHKLIDNPTFKQLSLFLYLIKTHELGGRLIELPLHWNSPAPFFDAFSELLDTPNFCETYVSYWTKAFDSYVKRDISQPIFWLTNACGAPNPKPDDWPRRKAATGFESISDGKSSVGMDRTDDIKKAIYQVLKLGAEFKKDTNNIHVAIISNVHAVRHYEEYLKALHDIVWTRSQNQVSVVGDLDDNTPLFNLFDGILAFTNSEYRNTWVHDLFNFDN